MNITDLRKPLLLTDLDFRIQSINNGKYATILVYKDARADMNRLDNVCGALNWKREHTKDNHNCIVSIWNDETKQWISKEDTGTESMTEQKKGLASDSFKRACFNWGIGRELYEYPIIQIKLNDDEVTESDYNGKKSFKASWGLKLKEWIWAKQVDKEGNIVYLAAKDNNDKSRFTFGKYDESLKLEKSK